MGVLGVLGINTAKTYLSGASSDMTPKNVLAKPDEEGKSAVISWNSDKESMGIVEYGTTPASLLLRAPESDQTINHSLTLSPLKANTNYYFRIRVGEEVFDNNGIPYSFKTKAGVVPTLVPTVVLVPTMPVVSGSECNRTSDYNKDGITNSLDYMYCLKNKPSGTVAVPSPETGKCPGGVDYNKDGVINSLDKLKCLQDNK
ncbi:TPA: hypothetical protein DD455_00770 [Candidatus Shapirobacteria bacterium]|nr:hypothetical protein [Candidatus Shapirobacteria bacterium]